MFCKQSCVCNLTGFFGLGSPLFVWFGQSLASRDKPVLQLRACFSKSVKKQLLTTCNWQFAVEIFAATFFWQSLPSPAIAKLLPSLLHACFCHQNSDQLSIIDRASKAAGRHRILISVLTAQASKLARHRHPPATLCAAVRCAAGTG